MFHYQIVILSGTECGCKKAKIDFAVNEELAQKPAINPSGFLMQIMKTDSKRK